MWQLGLRWLLGYLLTFCLEVRLSTGTVSLLFIQEGEIEDILYEALKTTDCHKYAEILRSDTLPLFVDAGDICQLGNLFTGERPKPR